MKIAYIFAYFGDGGAEESAILLAQQAKNDGNEVIFIIDKSSELALDRIKGEDFKIINLPMKSSFNPFFVSASAIGLNKIIKSEKIDIVHSHMLREQSVAIGAKILGCKFILVRTFHRLDQFNLKMKPFMPIYRKFTDAIISISDGMSEYLRANGLIDNVHLIKNGVVKVEAPQHIKALGFIGRLTTEKGILKFVKANINILRANKLVIAGDGPDFANLNYFTKMNRLNIEFLGKITDKAKFYKKISVLVLPSRTEVLPLVVLEAYSCGLPVVAFDLNSLRSLIAKGNGVRIEYPNYKQMGQEAVKLIPKSSLYYKANIAKYESDYSVEKMWDKVDKLYKSLLHK